MDMDNSDSGLVYKLYLLVAVPKQEDVKIVAYLMLAGVVALVLCLVLLSAISTYLLNRKDPSRPAGRCELLECTINSESGPTKYSLIHQLKDDNSGEARASGASDRYARPFSPGRGFSLKDNSGGSRASITHGYDTCVVDPEETGALLDVTDRSDMMVDSETDKSRDVCDLNRSRDVCDLYRSRDVSDLQFGRLLVDSETLTGSYEDMRTSGLKRMTSFSRGDNRDVGQYVTMDSSVVAADIITVTREDHVSQTSHSATNSFYDNVNNPMV